MGFRTIVALNNDMAHEWQNDPELGRMIAHDMNFVHDRDRFGDLHNYGRVVECTHADTQTLLIAEHYDATPVAHGHWYRGQTQEQRDLALLKALADKLGYRVSKKPAGK